MSHIVQKNIWWLGSKLAKSYKCIHVQWKVHFILSFWRDMFFVDAIKLYEELLLNKHIKNKISQWLTSLLNIKLSYFQEQQILNFIFCFLKQSLLLLLFNCNLNYYTAHPWQYSMTEEINLCSFTPHVKSVATSQQHCQGFETTSWCREHYGQSCVAKPICICMSNYLISLPKVH